MADYTYNPPPKSNAPAQSPSGDEKGAARIWKVFDPTIVLDEMSVPDDHKENKRKTQRIQDLASTSYPLIKINDYFLGEAEIDLLKINSTDKLPKITLSASFSHESFLAKEMPKDGDIISVMIQSGSDVLKPIRNDYVITGVIPVKKSSIVGQDFVSMTFYGELFVPGYRSFLGTSSIKGTSMEALKFAAQELGLGFSTNEENTIDTQIWLAINTVEEFITEVCERSWKDENSFFDWWIDIYYNLNFVNVQKQLLSSETEIDEAALTDNVKSKYYWGNRNDQTVGSPKVFSNYKGYKNTSFYIETWRPINNSTKITFEYGTSMDCTFYEHNQILYEDDSKKYWNLDIPPDYDPEKLDTHILLRGRATWDSSYGGDSLPRANYSYQDLYRKSPWLGIQYTLTNPDDDPTKWTGNHHPNYMRARVHNTINMVELDKLNVEVNVNGINLNIIKGDKVPIAIVRMDRTENRLLDSSFKAPEMLDLFYSGWYYVKGFEFGWVFGEQGAINNFTESLILTRREWPTPLPSTARPKEQTE